MVIIDNITLPPPAQGLNYAAWLIDDTSEHVTALGMLKQDNGAWGLRYNGSGNLIAAGNRFEITLESQAVPAPQGQIVLAGTFPPTAFSHIKHLLVAFDTTPNHQGFLVGLLRQSQVLFDESQRVNVFVQRGLNFSTQCSAQSVLDVLEGKNGQNYQPLSQDCQNLGLVQIGDGFGILGTNGYIEGAIDHATLAAQSNDADSHIKQHAQHVQIAMDNVRKWLNQADALALQVRNGDSSKAQQLADICKLALFGQNLDSDESVDPVPNEAGVIVGYQHGQLLATLKLTKPLQR
jgi:hypothetical protein